MNAVCNNCSKFLAEKNKALKKADSVFDAASDLSEFIDTCFKSCDKNPNRIYTRQQVAEILYDLFGDSYACNYNGIDEWLPLLCDRPENKGCFEINSKTYCWEQYLKHISERSDVCEKM